MTKKPNTRHKDANWTVHTNEDNRISYEGATLAVLMDIRDELQELNATFNCHRFQGIPVTLDRIDRRLSRKLPLIQRRKKRK